LGKESLAELLNSLKKNTSTKKSIEEIYIDLKKSIKPGLCPFHSRCIGYSSLCAHTKSYIDVENALKQMGFSGNDVYNLINRFTESGLMTICNGPTIKEKEYFSEETVLGALYGATVGAVMGVIGGPVGVIAGASLGALIGGALSKGKEKIRTLNVKSIIFKK